MTKKLKLSDFLASQESTSSPVDTTTYSGFTYSLNEFKESISDHAGSFIVDSKNYPAALSSDYSVYFYDGEKSPSLIVYESIMDIKKRDNTLLVFSTDNPRPVIITLN